ncbi:NAD(P)-binding protein [Xylariaceae sp. FL1019]|nr:NAD(P)-binding protein [Xylariaceae sp. FL1019]
MAAATGRAKPLTWLITGSSSGFGLQLARLAQAQGHNVIATSRNPGRTPELVQEITDRGGKWLQLDLNDQNIGKMVEDLETSGTPIDVLVNSAGSAIVGPLESFSEDEIRRQMEICFFGPYRLMRAVAPFMRKRRSGLIVNISSGAGMEARESLGGYGASKSAMDAVSRVLHKELADFDVRVLLVYLGSFNTPMIVSNTLVEAPLDSDYEGTTTGLVYNIIGKGTAKMPGDHVKACQAIYDVAMNKGWAKGLGNEIMLPLGVDMGVRVRETQDRLEHMMDVFGHICNSVNADD